MDFGGLCGPKPDLLIKKSPHADLAALRGPEFVTLDKAFGQRFRSCLKLSEVVKYL